MANKRAAIDALMPGSGKGNFGNSSGITTDSLPNNTVTITDSDTQPGHRRNRGTYDKAIKKTYSFNPRTITGLERYAAENAMSCSQVINLALRQLIPRSYFEDD